MVKKDKKAKSAEQKAAKIAKQSKKAAKGEKKSKAKQAEVDSDADDDMDLDAVLAQYAEQQAKFLKVTEQPCKPPSPRSAATFVASPSNNNELLLFGGEFYDGNVAVFYNDLFVYQVKQGEWKKVTSPNSPLPRSGHAWCRGGNTGGVYLFGGEFSSPKQGTFYHYNDFWHLDTETREWSRLEAKGKGQTPPARSGHRMTYWKNYIVLFGGFQDTSVTTKYLQDVWIYDVRENKWHEFKPTAAAQKPDARSSYTFLPHETGAVIYGGYSRVKTITTAKQQGKGGPQRNVLKPMIHQDTWFLRIIAPATEAAAGTPPMVRWERRKRPANAPNPPRAGLTMAHHKGRGIAFGGVLDVEVSEEGIESEFFNDLFIWNIDRNRIFPVALRRPKTGGKQRPQPVSRRDRAKADEEELLRNLAALETKGSIAGADDIDMRLDGNNEKTAEDDTPKREYPVKFEMPHQRFNALLTVQEDILYIFGGTFDKKDIEITFSDLYAIDLGKLDGVKELFYEEPVNWGATAVESDDEDEDDEDEDMDDDEDGSDALSDSMSVDAPSTAPTEVSVQVRAARAKEAEDAAMVEEEKETKAEEDPRPMPRPFESLRDFFVRTTNDWQNMLLEKMKYGASQQEDQSVKELRKKAFEMAEDRWWDAREEVQVLEDEQEAAGIGDVVSLAERETTGAGRRR